jgi:tRNA (guanosine-2'-O-)-methyltransferase
MTEADVLFEMYDLITPNKREMFDRIAADRTRHLTVVLENVYQEHNASAILRTCDCFGIQDLYVIEKQFRYEVKRDIALGAGRWVDMFTYSEGNEPDIECIKQLKSKGYKIVATTPHTNDKTIHEIDLTQPIALVFGTERRGISDSMKEMADEFVRIPMYGFTESFNVSVAAALTMNVLRERLEQSDLTWKIDSDAQIQLKLEWCRKILRGGQALEDEIRNRLFQKE